MFVSVSDTQSENIYLCSCGAPKARTSAHCASCHTRKRWSKFYANKKINQILCLCACGCGNAVKRKGGTFFNRKCTWRYKRENAVEVEKKDCLCGCGQKVRNNLKHFASKACAVRSKEKNMPIRYRDSEGYLTLIDRATIITDAFGGNKFAIQVLKDLRFTRVFKNGNWLVL